MIIQPILNPWVLGSLIVIAFVSAVVLAVLHKNRSTGRSVRWINRAAIVLLLGVLAFRPGIGTVEEAKIYANQFDIYFVVDATGSMNAEDWNKEPRLGAVKDDITELVKHYPGSRYALIGFNKDATIRVPLTTDAATLLAGVNVFQTEITKNSSGSSISVAKDLLFSTLDADKKRSPDKQRIIFFFSDGEQTVSTAPESFSTIAPLVHNGKVYGYGTESGGQMKRNNGLIITTGVPEYIMDTSQNPPVIALSKIDESNLRAVAEQLGVTYQHRTPDNNIDFINLEDSKLVESGTQSLKIAADFSWLIAILLLILVSIELLFVIIIARKTFGKRRNI